MWELKYEIALIMEKTENLASLKVMHDKSDTRRFFARVILIFDSRINDFRYVYL